MVPSQLQIGRVAVRPATVLAPMSGLTDTVFRRFIRRLGGCGLIMTEFTSGEGLARDWVLPAGRPRRSLRYLHFVEEERPISAQLFGADPARLAAAARIVQELGFDLVDLNVGCPAKKVVRCQGGSSLLHDLPLLRRILRAIRAAVTIPFTVKFRSGWSAEEIVAADVARMAEDCGLDAVALHPRTRLQGFGGTADWGLIAKVKQAVRIPVIGNGDIRVAEDAGRMVAETGCDGIMIGRAAAANPWIFRQISELGAGGDYRRPSEADRYQMMRDYYRMLIEEANPEAAGKMKQFATYFTHGVRNGAKLRADIYHARDAVQILGLVDAFFERELAAPAA